MPDLAAIDRHRMLDGKKRRIGNNRRAIDRATGSRRCLRNINEHDFPDRDRRLASREGELLAKIGGAIAENSPPDDMQIAIGTCQLDRDLLPWQTLGIARSIRPGGELFRDGRADYLQFRSVDEGSVGENQAEEISLQGDFLSAGLVAQFARCRTMLADLPGRTYKTVIEVDLPARNRNEEHSC